MINRTKVELTRCHRLKNDAWFLRWTSGRRSNSFVGLSTGKLIAKRDDVRCEAELNEGGESGNGAAV
jgi:hypothetical protein